MFVRKNPLILASGLALALAACGDSETVDEATQSPDFIEEPAVTLSPLTTEQQLARDNFDRAAFLEEYNSHREEILSGSDPVPAAADMDFAFLDRNGDGGLSVAEYAIRSAPVDPQAAPGPDGSALGDSQIDVIADNYYRHDANADSSLSEAELQAAIASGTPI